MEYVFGTKGEVEILKTKGSTHTDLTGYHQIEQTYPDQVTTDNFRVVKKVDSQEDEAGNCYDWYEIDRHYRTVDKSGPAAEAARSAGQTAGIAFVRMAETGTIDDVTAGEHTELFAEWAENVAYTAQAIRAYEGVLYRCVQDHTSQAGWEPPATPAMWTKIADPAEEWPAWSQPIGAHDAYNDGDKVRHDGKHWISTVGNNVWTPGTYGWSEVVAEV